LVGIFWAEQAAASRKVEVNWEYDVL